MKTLPMAPAAGRMARSSLGSTLNIVAVYDGIPAAWLYMPPSARWPALPDRA